MPIEHPLPTQSTLKELYANAYCCARPNCRRPLYKVDSETGVRTLNSRVAHICARREGGPRWNPNQSADENRASSNLLLLCIEDAAEIDQPNRVADFPVTLLREWKKQQLADFDAIGQGWALTPEMAREAAAMSFEMGDVRIARSVLGGSGGNAPGAGGGGGGAIGPGARAGAGGPGGQVRYEGSRSHPNKPQPSRSGNPSGYNADALAGGTGTERRISLSGGPGTAPGAGGGGAGAVGANARAGDGGGGGEHVIAHVSPEELAALRAEGFDHIEVCVGEGGTGSEFSGEHGQDGSDSVLHFVAADGRILRTIRAAGGKGGKADGALPDGTREALTADIAQGLSLTTMLLCDTIQIRSGLISLLSGGWEFWNQPAVPANIRWPLLVVLSRAKVDLAQPIGFYVVVNDPTAREVVRLPFVIGNDNPRPVAMVSYVVNLQFTATVSGVWSIEVISGRFCLGRLPIEIRTAGST